MRKNGRLFGTAVIMLAVLALAVACSDDDDNNNVKKDTGVTADKGAGDLAKADSGPAADTGAAKETGATDTGSIDGTTATVTLTGSFVIFGTTTVVDGVKVCVSGSTTLCTTSSATGTWSLANVPDKDLILEMTKSGYYPYAALYGKGQASTSYSGTSLLTPTLVATMTTVLGTTEKAGKGHIIFTSAGTTSGAAGTSITVTPASGEGPYYLSAIGLPDKTLTSTTAAGRAFVLNVDPGDYTLAFTNGSLTCTLQSGWASTNAGELKLRVVKDSATLASATCK